MSPSDLTATLYFAAAVRAGADSSLTRLLPLDRLKEPLSPHENFSQRILFSLQALGAIQPELSLANAEDWLTAKDWTEIGLQTLAWRICWSLRDCRDRSAMANALLSSIEPSEDALEVLFRVWEDLALAEVVQYASWSLAKSGYNPRWAQTGVASFRKALNTFSITQVMHLVQLAIRSVASTHHRGGILASRLGGVFADAVGSFSRRAVCEKWILRATPRPTELPISTLAAMFAQEVTRLDDDYLMRTPSTAALLDAMTRAQSVH
ncbi:MAG: hypothetical protein E6K53_17225 [Gammaproteobacteria bacterium]|nr:MAG: hypothetical protein E6K53_17225 [Gammaproteobacteria bacterium]